MLHVCEAPGMLSDVRARRAQDFFRKSVIPAYTDIQRVDRDRVRGIVEFDNREDLKRAIKDLDGAAGALEPINSEADPSFACLLHVVESWCSRP